MSSANTVDFTQKSVIVGSYSYPPNYQLDLEEGNEQKQMEPITPIRVLDENGNPVKVDLGPNYSNKPSAPSAPPMESINVQSADNMINPRRSNLSQGIQMYKEELSRQKRESAEWNIAKQQLKLGNAYTYPNKLGFGVSPFFKLNEEKY